MNSALLRGAIHGALGFAAALTIEQGAGVLSAGPRLQAAAGQSSPPAAAPQQGRGRGMQFSEPFDLTRLSPRREKQNESSVLRPWYVDRAVNE